MKEVNNRNDLSSTSEKLVGQMINALPDAAFICDEKGLVIANSDEVYHFFSINDTNKIIGSSLQSFFAFSHVEEAYLLLSSAIRTNSRLSNKLLVKKNFSETHVAQVTFSSFQQDDVSGKYAVVIFREISGTETDFNESNKKGARLSRIIDILTDREYQPHEILQKLISQIGETLGAMTCAYSRVENNRLRLISAWESPFNPGISPKLCNQQIFDYIIHEGVNTALIREPLLSVFLLSESVNATESGVKTLFGVPIGFNTIDGILTVVFTSNFSLSEIDEHYIRTISALMADKISINSQLSAPAKYSFDELIDYLSDPAYIVSAEGAILEVNKSAVTNFGFEREELIGKPLSLFSAEALNDMDKITAAYNKALHDGPQKFEWWGKRKNGELFLLEINCSKSMYKEQQVILAVGRDLTELKQKERDLTLNNKELEESNESKDKFFSIIAHDLKNPFQGLLGFIDLLYEDLEELSMGQVKEYLSNARNASYQTYDLLENLLAWSRIQNGKMPFSPTVFCIRDEIDSVISVLENNARIKKIKLFNKVEKTFEVEADRNMIHSIIQNLVTNSIKFSNNGGEVIIRGRELQKMVNENNTPENDQKSWIEISISDHGIGISEDILPYLFKLNGQSSHAGTAHETGTGLGLALSHEMVEKNGGRIWAESIAGKGTTLLFTVPLR